MPWTCMQCGFQGRGIRARDSHEIYHLHRELAILRWKENVNEVQNRNDAQLCALARDLAVTQRAYHAAKKAMYRHLRNHDQI